jgi:prepilin-type N-terminal cleavage/methylation domain-containing protein
MRTLVKRLRAFTLIELLTVMAVIVVLAGLTLMGAGYANKKAATSRAEAEIQALSAALESYKADQGTYPIPTDAAQAALRSGTTFPPDYSPLPTKYFVSSRALYQGLSADGNDALLGGSIASSGSKVEGATRYFDFKTKMLGGVPSTGIISGSVYVQDPFGYCYGYYTPNVTGSGASSATGYNPNFDLWCTGGSTLASGSLGWNKNW